MAIAACKHQRQIWANVNKPTIGPKNIPGMSMQTDAEISNFIKETLVPVWHAAVTYMMGPMSDSTVVVGADIRVHGVQRLRVLDTSSFPFLLSVDPQGTIDAVTEGG